MHCKGGEYVRETFLQMKKKNHIESTSINISGSGMRLTFLGILPAVYGAIFPELKQDTESLLHTMVKIENKE